jgi:hypothetical protein
VDMMCVACLARTKGKCCSGVNSGESCLSDHPVYAGSSTVQTCPICHSELSCDEVDIGVGIQTGNYRCDCCGWYPDLDDADIDRYTNPDDEV